MSVKNATNNNTVTTKARYWTAVGYPENMVDDWQDRIGEILQIPYAYCIHDKDKTGDDDDRKTHVHIVVVYGNTTTYKSALSVFDGLSAPGKQAFNTCERVNNIRYLWNYLIHDTDDARKKGKYQYSPDERITGNNFDIGAYEQLGIAEKKAIRKELAQVIIDKAFMNYLDFYMCVIDNFPDEYEEVASANSGMFERLTKGNFQKWKLENMKRIRD